MAEQHARRIERHPERGEPTVGRGHDGDLGRLIVQMSTGNLKTVTLELGGKSPTIVLDDADLDHAVAGVLYGIFSSSGEACIAGSRLFVARPLYEPFMQRLVAAAANQVTSAINNAELYRMIRESAERMGGMLRAQRAEASHRVQGREGAPCRCRVRGRQDTHNRRAARSRQEGHSTSRDRKRVDHIR